MTNSKPYYMADPMRPKTLAGELLLAALLLRRGWRVELVLADLDAFAALYRPPARA